jgi:sugar phosphate permease
VRPTLDRRSAAVSGPSARPIPVRSVRIFYGWLIVGAGMGIQALQGALLSSAYGAYVVLLQADYGWSRTIFSLGYGLQQMESGLLGPVQGWAIDRFGPRAVMRVGIIIFGAGFMLFSRIDSVQSFFLVFFTIAVGVSLSGFLPITVTIVNWFERRRATAMGIMSTGMGIGGLLVPLTAWSLNTHGWRATAFASGVLIILIGLPLTQMMRHRPEPYGYLPDGRRRDSADSNDKPARITGDGTTGQVSFTAREALRTRAFWFISFGHAAALLVVSAVMVHLVLHLKESLGYSVTRGAAIVALVTATSMVGQVSGGVLGDRISKRLIVTCCMFGHMIALLFLAYASALWMVVVFAVMQGLAWGMRGPLMQAIRADYFGRASFGTIMGFSSMVIMLGTVGGPMVAGVMADHFGNYRAGFTVLAVLAGLGSLFWIFSTKPSPPVRASGTSAAARVSG